MAKRATEGVADDDGDAEPFVEGAGGGVRVEREQDDGVRAGCVRGVDASRGADEAVPCLGDDERRAAADDADGLAQDDLDMAGVAVSCVRACFLGGRDLGERDHAALRLGYGLLGHHEDVTGLEAARSTGCLREQLCEVVSLLDLGNALQREDLDSDHSRPVRRIPACAL
ncbi:MAG: hypothetical protein K0S82_1654 [Gaiellaceae bacterium]|nr:hypothetical protein [Gaiellaceae bacterium]